MQKMDCAELIDNAKKILEGLDLPEIAKLRILETE